MKRRARYANPLHRALAIGIKGKPALDKQVTWLRRHRATVAFVLCVCSGPWRIERRRKVQEQALAVIGASDLTDVAMRKRLVKMLPLTWQKTLVKNFARYASKQGEEFDVLFSKSKRERMTTVATLQEITGKENLPKVVWMFVRDYWFVDCFPADRHVRRWCIEHELPMTSAGLVDMFNEIPKAVRGVLPLRSYARAVFGDHSANPVFPKQ